MYHYLLTVTSTLVTSLLNFHYIFNNLQVDQLAIFSLCLLLQLHLI